MTALAGTGTGGVLNARTVVLACPDAVIRERLRVSLSGLRWQVREASGGAEAIEMMEASRPEALLVDSWLPDLEVGEFAGMIRRMYPGVDLLRVDGVMTGGTGARSPRRNELLHAMREAQESGFEPAEADTRSREQPTLARAESVLPAGLSDMVGSSAVMLELGRLIALVAPRSTPVLIEGETGTGTRRSLRRRCIA